MIFKLTLENAAQLITDETAQRLFAVGVQCSASSEDEVAYICFTLPKGGEAE